MSLAQRLAWLEVVSTLAILSAVMLTSVPPEGIGGMGVTTATAAAAAQILPRFFIIMGICFVCFYFCDLYNFEDPHDFGDLFGRLCRALGWSALLLATTYVVFPTTIVRGNFESHAAGSRGPAHRRPQRRRHRDDVVGAAPGTLRRRGRRRPSPPTRSHHRGHARPP